MMIREFATGASRADLPLRARCAYARFMRARCWPGVVLAVVAGVSSAWASPDAPASAPRERAPADRPFQTKLFGPDVPLGSLPLSVAIETSQGVSTVVIPRGTALPASYVDTFSTANDDQLSVEVHVLQGERPLVSNNRTVAKLQLRGIPPAVRGVPQIEVTLAIDKAGVLTVRARDLATDTTHLFITSSATTPPPGKAAIERMLAEAEAARAEDEHQRQLLEARVRLDAAIYGGRKVVADHGAKLSRDVQERCTRALDEAERAASSNDLATLRDATAKLQAAVHAATAALYRRAAPPP
jgi:molecular chaperone DnaK